MSVDVSKLTAHLGYWIRQVSNHVSQSFARKLAAQNITVAEWALLRVLYGQNSLPPSQVARTMGVTKGAITKLADRLLAKGLISRKASDNDARAQTLSLTAGGKKLVPRLAALADLNDAECFSHLSQGDMKRIRQILEDTVVALDIKTMPIN